MYDLINIFDVFLPQLLLYPNPTDPLNGDAAALLLREPERYKAKVSEYLKRYATEEKPALKNDKTESEEEMSDFSDVDENEDEATSLEL